MSDLKMLDMTFCGGRYTVAVTLDGPLTDRSPYTENAVHHEAIDLASRDGTALSLTVRTASRAWPELVVAMRFEHSGGFHPGILLIEETDLLLVGAGTYLLAYGLSPARRLWEDYVTFGFWNWSRHGGTVLMSSELEFAAYDLNARKRWSRSVDPPWTFHVDDGRVHLDVDGTTSTFDLTTGT